jgi:hypothetical protein
MENELHDIAVALSRIADALEGIVKRLGIVVDEEKHCIRMVDVDRAKVYSTHLGEKLRDGKAAETPKS